MSGRPYYVDWDISHMFKVPQNVLSLHQVKGANIGLIGFSKGGDLCLSMASFLKGITATVLVNSCVANSMTALHYKEMTIPSLGSDLSKCTVTESGFLESLHIWNNPLEKPNHQSLIPLEKAQGPFLFIVGKDDHNWKSEFYAHIASDRLQAHGKDRPQIICYPGAGHCIDPPYFPARIASVHPVLGLPVFYGGEPRAHGRAQVDAWQQIQTFFHKHLDAKISVKPSKL
ncbi:acyl-coenzyme A thioesterase 6-like [Echinops telfairi]|uniref:Acyl-coenzyme A thioesterase 6-like n=1 Tax=Echinops telfairi TaxID=9371 RepID=A0AC55CX93_ECHTE|nr:acyl-coenzyme A thioesterase 6-like [Echinops telfairi]